MKKSFTLVETLVSLTIFSLIVGVSLTTFTVINQIKRKEINYMYFESICLDIDKYYTKYGVSWDSYYYPSASSSLIYYDYSYQICEEENKVFVLEYSYNDYDELIVNIVEVSNNKPVIENLNYGGSRNV